ncbi:MAG TPA: hypothetical protein VGQ59_01245 [Cyclobacteriaceae bacterium]|jgi:hypothetical protein|nr:hypothetical protein [Cyclobacteriaceae bacterium]
MCNPSKARVAFIPNGIDTGMRKKYMITPIAKTHNIMRKLTMTIPNESQRHRLMK